MSALGLKGTAVTPTPAIVVNFRSYASGCAEPTTCSVQVADTVLRQGQGMHGSFSRGDTLNFMAAVGPDFKAGFADPPARQQRRCRLHRGAPPRVDACSAIFRRRGISGPHAPPRGRGRQKENGGEVIPAASPIDHSPASF